MSMTEAYFDNLIRILETVRDGQREGMEKAAAAMAECVHQGHMVYTFGTGHGHLLALEVFYRAGGMAQVCPILREDLMLHVNAAESSQVERREDLTEELLSRYPVGKGDVLFVISNSGRNACPVLLAREARKRGAFVIALTNLRHTRAVTARNSAGLRLFETADLVLDNGGILGDASMEFPDGRFCGATSTAVGAAILQAVTCRCREILLEKGWGGDFYMSSNVDGGDAVNQVLVEKYRDSIPGLG